MNLKGLTAEEILNNPPKVVDLEKVLMTLSEVK
jgi:hypothetical protein